MLLACRKPHQPTRAGQGSLCVVHVVDGRVKRARRWPSSCPRHGEAVTMVARLRASRGSRWPLGESWKRGYQHERPQCRQTRCAGMQAGSIADE